MATTRRAGRAAKTRGRSGSTRKREKDRSPSAAPAVLEITKEETANLPAKPSADPSSLPGFTVTVRGSMPKVLAGVVLRKGPIRAHSREAAIARFMSDLGSQFKKPDLLDVEEVEVVESKGPLAPSLPFRDGAAKDGTAAAGNGQDRTTTAMRPGGVVDEAMGVVNRSAPATGTRI